jgi:BirA family transcriptional regulator, biotin operon repressor / biotin---[acetyl-CoA-carboxylase] ligase
MMIHWHDCLGSTMDEAHALAEQGAPHGTAVAAREQTAGRGRRGRAWQSARGGLWLSVVCRPTVSSGMEHLSVRVGLAVAEALERLFPELPRVTVKWPNDLLLEGRKLAGILCEARWEGERPAWVIAALGMNVINPIPDFLVDQATSLAEHIKVRGPERLVRAMADVIANAAATPGLLSPDERARLQLREVIQ